MESVEILDAWRKQTNCPDVNRFNTTHIRSRRFASLAIIPWVAANSVAATTALGMATANTAMISELRARFTDAELNQANFA